MSAVLQFKQAISKQLAQLTPYNAETLTGFIRVPRKSTEGHYSVSLAMLSGQLKNQGVSEQKQCDPVLWSEELIKKFKPDEYISSVTTYGNNLCFNVNQSLFSQQVLQQVHQENSAYGWADVKDRGSDKPVVVIDYSSPNIAKPFHAGHLRSTIIGNFSKRIHEAMGYKAIGINYLGDWGKQYGLLAIGFERYGNEKSLMNDPIRHLYDVYVRINQESKEDHDIDRLASDYFRHMEEGNERAILQWKRFRDMSIDSYASIYKRLDVHFDIYSGESQINAYIPRVYDLLKERNLLTRTENGALVVDLERYRLGKPVIQRADGTSLYITRDLASIMMRREKYKFDKALYVVGEEQGEYFKQLFKTAELLFGGDSSDAWTRQLHHIGFGRVNGMSSRKGTAIFLQDILNTAKERSLDYMKQFPDKYSLICEGADNENMLERMNTIADKAGVSAILIQDMKSKRIKSYNFAWDRMTDASGDTGIALQYAHVRASSIERKSNTRVHSNCNFDLLKEEEAFALVQMISYFPDLVKLSFTTLEPCVLVNYLFKLSHATGQASHTLRVKGAETEIAEARMLLFWAAKTTLFNGLSLLGIQGMKQI
ncbi:arginyl-tRNA synthetase [Spinellus fusiger]|nr:arginyl-tRNA synthetase [Spinellus fusiger]